MPDLFTPLDLGALRLPNRILMAPLSRMRSAAGNVPGPLAPDYYAQRASAGLVISEATQISEQGRGFPGTPGIHTDDQVAGWRRVTDAVHDAEGRIVVQLWHPGRMSHPRLQFDGRPPVAPSAVRPDVLAFLGPGEMVPSETPRALETSEVEALLDDFTRAAEHAKAAGFDGVEVASAYGYLIDQFLNDRTNLRTDHYGGPIENRARFLLEVVERVADAFGADRVGVRLSPFATVNDIGDSDPEGLFGHVIPALGRSGIAYLHLLEPRAAETGLSDTIVEGAPSAAAAFSRLFPGPVIVTGGFDFASATEAIDSGVAAAVGFGRLFLANPDLPARFASGAALNAPERATFYGGDERGYTDYPALGRQGAGA